MPEQQDYIGPAFHVHHDMLWEWCKSYNERYLYIVDDKPEDEQPTRLVLMQPFAVELGDAEKYAIAQQTHADWQRTYADWEKASADRRRASDARETAYDDWQRANAAWEKAYDEWRRAIAAWEKAYDEWQNTISPNAISALHVQQCPNCPWDGKTIFPESGNRGS